MLTKKRKNHGSVKRDAVDLESDEGATFEIAESARRGRNAPDEQDLECWPRITCKMCIGASALKREVSIWRNAPDLVATIYVKFLLSTLGFQTI